MVGADVADLLQRIQVLEDTASIKDLQYSYWRCVDSKRPKELRQLLAEGGIEVAFPGQPVMRDPDLFAEATAVSPASWQGTHIGSAPHIAIDCSDTASGYWRVQMLGYDFEQRLTVRMALEYECNYVKQAGRWKIKAMKARQQTLDVTGVTEEGGLSSVAFGPVGT